MSCVNLNSVIILRLVYISPSPWTQEIRNNHRVEKWLDSLRFHGREVVVKITPVKVLRMFLKKGEEVQHYQWFVVYLWRKVKLLETGFVEVLADNWELIIYQDISNKGQISFCPINLLTPKMSHFPCVFVQILQVLTRPTNFLQPVTSDNTPRNGFFRFMENLNET